MAFLIGLVSKEEKSELERRGWEFEEPPDGYRTEQLEDREEAVRDGKQMVMVFVDSSVFRIMDGPDWEQA